MATDQRERAFAALADTNRVRLLRLLAAGPASATGLCGQLDITRQAVDKHLAVLHAANLVRSRRVGREVLHSVSPPGFDELAAALALVRSEATGDASARRGAQADAAAGGRVVPAADATSGRAGERHLGVYLQPTEDLDAEVESWRSLGMTVLWRPDASTVLLGSSGRAAVMCVDHALERELGAGPVFVTWSLDEDRPRGVAWRISPCTVPSGRYGAFVTVSGRVVRLLEVRSTGRAALFGAGSGSR